MVQAQARQPVYVPRRLSRLAGILVLVVLVAGLAGFIIDRLSVQSSEERAANACINQYNSYIQQAKANLVKGDRTSAINSLVAAKAQLHRCEVARADSVSAIWH